MSFSCLSLFVLLIFSLMSKVFVLLSYFYYKMYSHKFHSIPPGSGPSMTGKKSPCNAFVKKLLCIFSVGL